MVNEISVNEMQEYVAKKITEETGEKVDPADLEHPRGELCALIIAYQYYRVRDVERKGKQQGELTFGDSIMYTYPDNGVNYKIYITKDGYISASIFIGGEWLSRCLGYFATKWNYTVNELVELLHVGRIWEGGNWVTDFRDV